MGSMTFQADGKSKAKEAGGKQQQIKLHVVFVVIILFLHVVFE